MQSRFRSKIVWTSTFTLIIFILKTYFNIEIPKVDELVNLVLVLATALGVWNDPTNKKGW